MRAITQCARKVWRVRFLSISMRNNKNTRSKSRPLFNLLYLLFWCNSLNLRASPVICALPARHIMMDHLT